MIKTEECKKSKVRFFGDDIGFQFSHVSQGSRIRKTSVCKIQKVDKAKQIEDIERQIIERGRGMLFKAKKRRLPHGLGPFTVYVGESQFRFRGEEPRKVKVWGHGYKKDMPTVWESYEPSYD